LRVSEIYNKLDELYPFRISDEYIKIYGGYDNSGIIIDLNNEVQKIVFSLDFSNNTVEKAIFEKADLIITHHPAIYNPIKSLSKNQITGGNIIKAIQNNISVISMHLNCDFARGGIDQTLAKLFNPKNIKILQPIEQDTGYGRICEIEENSLEHLALLVKQEIMSDKIITYGKNEKIRRIAVFCGGGFEGEFFDKIKADLIISSDFRHHLIAEALERKISVMDITHYGAENYSFKKIYRETKDFLNIDSIYFEDKNLL